MNTFLKFALAVLVIGFMLVLFLFGGIFVRQVAYAMPMNWWTPSISQTEPGPYPPNSGFGGMWGRGWMHSGRGDIQMPWGQSGCWGLQNGSGWDNSTNAEPLSIGAAHDAVERYINASDNGNLEVGEIMIFSNHAYAQIIESDTEIGAMEVLVDPISVSVYPEYGPNMMWNLKYGMHAGNGPGRGHGMMGRSYNPNIDLSEPMQINASEAASIAQDYLTQINSPLTVDDHAEQFYGYYTFDTLEDGNPSGMLSVNGYTGDVFIHVWHGEFIEMEDAHE